MMSVIGTALSLLLVVVVAYLAIAGVLRVFR